MVKSSDPGKQSISHIKFFIMNKTFKHAMRKVESMKSKGVKMLQLLLFVVMAFSFGVSETNRRPS